MLRNADGNGKNLMALFFGHDDNSLSVEWSHTINSTTDFGAELWPTAEGDLRICRVGDWFGMAYRTDAQGEWTLLKGESRPLPATLQAGAAGHVNQETADMRGTLESIDFAPISDAGQCDD